MNTIAEPVKFAFATFRDEIHLLADNYIVARFERWTQQTAHRAQVRSKMERLAQLSKQELQRLVWANKHADTKGQIDGERSLLIYENGTCLIKFDNLTIPQLLKQLLYAKV